MRSDFAMLPVACKADLKLAINKAYISLFWELYKPKINEYEFLSQGMN